LQEAGITIAGEFDTLTRAQTSTIHADAIVQAPPLDDPSTADSERIDEPLTPREIDVLQLLADGLPNKSIAARLEVSDQTVKFHVASILAKLGATNRTEAVRLALRRGLISV
jgi:DNA-binding NarL/FixJ family response regulator